MGSSYPVGAEQYELVKQIGEGGSAIVYSASCVSVNETVACKIVNLLERASEVDCLQEETRIMSVVNHPNVMRCHVSFTAGTSLWVVMQHMDAGSCRQILNKKKDAGIGDEAVIATILKETLKGLHYLHNAGLAHRDVKADNIFVDGRTGTIKLGDLERCVPCDHQHCRTSVHGTPCFMAPEVIKCIPYDLECDIWSFGITAMELALGKAPLCEEPIKKILENTVLYPPPALHGRKFSRCFKDLVKTCLVKDPCSRPSAEELLKHPFFNKAKSSVSVARSLKAAAEKDASSSTTNSKSRLIKVLGLTRHLLGLRSSTKVTPLKQSDLRKK